MIPYLAALASVSLASAAHAEGHLADLAYGSAERNVMDIFLPEQGESPPMVLYIGDCCINYLGPI